MNNIEFVEAQFYESSDGSKFVEEHRVFGVEEIVNSEHELVEEGYSAEQQGIKSTFFSIEHGRR